jgi:hypothetical protein
MARYLDITELFVLLVGPKTKVTILAERADSVIIRSYSLLGCQHRIRRVRADSGFYGDHFLSFLEERALPFIVVARLTRYLKSRLYQVSEWQAIDKVYRVADRWPQAH